MIKQLFPLEFKKILSFVTLVSVGFLFCSVAFGVEPGTRADALGADGVYYGESVVALWHGDKIELPVPCQVIVLPDGRGLINSNRFYTGTLTIPVRGHWQRNKFRGLAKPSFRFGPRLAKAIEVEATYLNASKKLVVATRIISETKQTTTTFFKADTPEGKRYQSYWENPYSWVIPGRPFPRPIRNADRGEVAKVGQGLVGKFRVIDSSFSVWGRKHLNLELVNKPARLEGYTVRLGGAENFPRRIKSGEILKFTRDNPLIIVDPSYSNSFNVDLAAYAQDYKKPLIAR